MLPNERTIAVVLLTLLILQGVPAASAQQVQGVDLYVTSVSVSTVNSAGVVIDGGVVGTLGIVKVVVRNGGTTPSQSYNLFVGENGLTQCLDRGDNPNDVQIDEPQANRGCDKTNQPGIGTGGTSEITFRWTPTVAQKGVLNISTVLRSTTGGTTGLPPDDHPNNNYGNFTAIVHAPAVRAVPDREIPPHPGADLYAAWRTANITKKCPSTPNTPVREGCIAKPGSVLLFHYNVINDGNTQDAFSASLTGIAPYVRDGYNFSLSDTSFPTLPGKTRSIGVTVEIPGNATSGYEVNVNSAVAKLELTSGIRPEVKTNPSPPLPSLIIDRRYGVNLTTEEGIRIANATEPRTFNITLENFGNQADDYVIRFANYVGANTSMNGTRWNFPAPQTVTVQPWSSLTTMLTVTPPADIPAGKYSARVEVESLNDNSGDFVRNLTLTADLQQTYSITGFVEVGTFNRVPAEEALFSLSIRNHGNGYDNVTLRMDPLPAGWTGTLSSSTVALTPFGTSSATLMMVPPANAPKNFEARAFINATVSGPREVSPDQRARLASPLIATVRVTEGSNLRVEGGTAPAFVEAGGKASFTLRVTNTGNVQDKFNVDVTSDTPGWAAQPLPASVTLGPLQAADVRVEMTAPASATVGDTAALFTRIRSSVDTSRERTVDLSGRISGPDLFIRTVQINTSNPYAGDPIEILVTYGNSGNKAPSENVSFIVVWSQNGQETTIFSRDIDHTLLNGGVRLTERIVWNDTRDIGGAGTIIARIDPDDRIVEIDDPASLNEGSVSITLRSLDIRYSAPSPLSGRPGERVLYQDTNAFVVEYRGNQPSEPVKIIVESANGWGRSEVTTNLVRGNEQIIGADIKIPDVPGVAEDTLTMTIIPTLRPSAVRTVSTKTIVIDEQKPQISAVGASPETAVFGQDITLSATVVDATGLRSVRAFVVTPDGETKTVPLAKGEGNVWSATQAYTFTGLYRFYIEAVDGSADGNANSTRETAATFTVKPGSVPSVRLADGQSTTVRTGSVVRLNITDPLGVGTSTYEIRGITFQLPSPYHIDTSSFPAGVLVVNVTAANIYGATTTETFTLTLDNTPPGVRKVTVTPEKPKVNEDVTLSIETDGAVDAVTVTIKRDGQFVETRSAKKIRDGLFELTLSPSEGQYELDVAARDVAGNTHLEEKAVLFSAKPASIIPGPGLFMAALAAVGAAFVLRRRT